MTAFPRQPNQRKITGTLEERAHKNKILINADEQNINPLES